MKPLLEICELEIAPRHSGPAVVQLEHFTVATSEIVGFVGPSGSGKTLTALATMGLIAKHDFRITHGKILFEGRDLLQANDEYLTSLRGRRLSMIFQEPRSALNPVVACGLQMEDAIRFHTSVSPEEREKKVRDTLTSLGLRDCDRIMRSFPHELSGGQQQRVILAMAIVLKPALLIADEPTTALDPVARLEFVQLLDQLRREHGTAVLLISHDVAAIRAVADRTLFIRDGKMDLSKISQAGSSRTSGSVVAEEPAPRQVDDAPVLQVERVSKSFIHEGSGRPVMALDDVSFNVWHMQTVGIIGRSASGKSTLARCICGLTRPDTGTVRIARSGHTKNDYAHRIAARQALQLIFQDPHSSLDPLMTVGDTVGEGLAVQGLSGEEIRQRVLELLDLVGLQPQHYPRLPFQLSGGQRQRIAIARALAVNPAILIADEPTSSLDQEAADQFIELLKSLKRQLSLTYLIISHDFGVLRRLSDRIIVLQDGKIVEDGETEKIATRPVHEETRQLIEAWRQTGQV